ncbi:protein-glutamate methylesterase/protein-glutamine glutaminase [Effusibacillus consociatus]|uniref:Protein-glutamate methylesterase/protein-glutamine glutaminase n=1 Tax=Effusibacillus consociatus TaxID=1117041 RepID=A0ABV9PYS7_9BACL
MKQYGVLVVDDSAFMRRTIIKILEGDLQFFTVGVARDGQEAVEKAQRLQPDVVTMDVEMPKLNGLQALEQIQKVSPVPVVMLSSFTDKGTQATLDALELGAVDFFLKSALIKDPLDPEIVKDFLIRVKAAAGAKIPKANHTIGRTEYLHVQKQKESQVDLVIIGSSTGGPSALQAVLPRFSPDFPVPILVLQHMPPGFTKPLADRFNNICNLKVKEAEDGDVLEPGTIYIAPSGFQTLIEEQRNGSKRLKIQTESPIPTLYNPSVDVTLLSAAPIFGDRLLSVILTGMGVDGLEGCKKVKEYQGRVIVEAEESCIVYGMPKAVFEAGYADRQSVLSSMYPLIMSHI